MYTHVLILRKKWVIFREFMDNVTHLNSFGLVWTAINEALLSIVSILDDIHVRYTVVMLGFGLLQGFWWKGYVGFFNDSFHVGGR